jgi:hypothetical protein
MRWLARIAVLSGLLALLPAATSLNAGPWDIVVIQSGLETQSLMAGMSFEVRGEGFHARVKPVKVCLDGGQCQLAEVDETGSFVVTRTISTPGQYTVEVHQAQNMSLTEWRLKTWKEVTVHD